MLGFYLFIRREDAAVEAHDSVSDENRLVHFVVGEGEVDVVAVVLGAQGHVGAVACVEPSHLYGIHVVVVALLENHQLDAVDGVGRGAFRADYRRSALRPFYHVRAVRILPVAVVGEVEAVVVALLAAVRVVEASQSRDDLVERKVGALHLVEVVGRYLPAARDRVERRHRDRGQNAEKDDGEEYFDKCERPPHSFFLQNVT